MNTKRTILSERESSLIEDLIAGHGIIVTFGQVYRELKARMSRQAARNLISKLMKNGWLVTIKRGVYELAGLESRGFGSLSTFKTAQVLVKNSYVSFEAALQHYGMFDQHLKTITSVSLKRYKTSEIQGTNYRFIKTKKELFYGYEEKRIENHLVKIATPEKAMLDLLNFKRNAYSIDLVLEKIKEYKKDLDFERLNEFCEKQAVTVQRITGFLLDRADINSGHLHDLIKTRKNCARMTKDSAKFNAKWRLYYEERFE